MTVARLMPLMFVLCSACRMFTGPDRVRTLGEIAGYHEGDPQISVEQDGRTLTVLITTYGGGCHARGETEVIIDGLTATISPWDYTAQSGTGCTRQLLSFEHHAVVQFSLAGTAQLRIRGIDISTRTSQNLIGDTVIVTRTVELP